MVSLILYLNISIKKIANIFFKKINNTREPYLYVYIN